MSDGFKVVTLTSFDNSNLVTYEWKPASAAKGVVLIVHGMCEHAKRYNEFAISLNKQGLIVFAFDLRGHGLTAGSPEAVCKYPDGQNIFADSVKDICFLADMLIEKYRLPLCVLGHSYGSFLTQGFMQNYNKHACVVLSGSAFMRDAQTMLGGVVAGVTKAFCGGDAKAKTIFKLSFGAYGKGFKGSSWLTRDNTIAKEYREDEYCGACPSANFYKGFFKGLNKVTQSGELAKIKQDIPVLITSGSRDPVGGKNISLVYKLNEKYKKAGLSAVELKVWEDARHEILNETNRREIQAHITGFILKNMA